MQKAHQPSFLVAISMNLIAISDFVREVGNTFTAVNSHFAEQKDKLILVLQQGCQPGNYMLKWRSYNVLI